MNAQSAMQEWQAAAYARLTSDTTLMSMITGVFDNAAVPQNQTFPYVTLGDITESPDNRFGRRGYDQINMLDIWDSSNGFLNAQNILAQLNRLLDQQVLTLATHAHVYTLYDNAQTLNDPGTNNIRHIPVRYKTFIQE